MLFTETKKQLNQKTQKPVGLKNALYQREERFSTLLENVPNVAVQGYNVNGIIHYWNRANEAVYGYTKTEAIGKNLVDLIIPPEMREAVRWDIKKGARTGEMPPAAELLLMRKDGSRVPVFSSHMVVRHSGHEPELFCINLDLTQLKKTEEELRNSEKKFRQTFLESPIGMVLCTPDEKIVEANPAFCQMLGYTEKELQDLTFSNITPKEDLEKEFSYYQRCIRQEMKGCQLKKCFTKKNNQPVWANLTVAIIRGDERNPDYILGMTEEITQIILVEEERRKLELQLRQANKMESIGTLAGGIAHDFNNILGAIMGYSEIARLHIPKNHKARNSIDQILKASNRAKDMVKQILAFSRQSKQEQKPIMLSPIIKETLKLLRASLPSTTEIRQYISTESDTLLGDQTQIHQLLMNLCTNAQYAMKKKDGILNITLISEEFDENEAKAHLDLKPGPYLKLSVSDTGHGIDPGIMGRLFDPYFTTKGKGEGTGLGLATCHSIVRSHKGAITVDSKLGKGTTFNVYLPMIAEEVQSEADNFETCMAGNERVLFVDDEEVLADLGKCLLQQLGYQVTPRTSSIEALEAFRAQPGAFDVVITDMTMPNMTGDMLAMKILEIRSDIPIIICTGFSEIMTNEEAERIGAKALLMKPLEITELTRTIQCVLGQVPVKISRHLDKF